MDWLTKIGEPAIENGGKISDGVKAAITSLDKLDALIKTKPNLAFLSRFLNLIKTLAGKIVTWIDEIIVLLSKKTGIVNMAKTKIDQIKGTKRDKNIEATYDMAANAVNKYLNPKPPQYATQNTKNTQIATQDTTNPRYYQPKTMPTTLKYN